MTDNDRIPQVLVVDDEPNIRELVQVALKIHGCAVTAAQQVFLGKKELADR